MSIPLSRDVLSYLTHAEKTALRTVSKKARADVDIADALVAIQNLLMFTLEETTGTSQIELYSRNKAMHVAATYNSMNGGSQVLIHFTRERQSMRIRLIFAQRANGSLFKMDKLCARNNRVAYTFEEGEILQLTDIPNVLSVTPELQEEVHSSIRDMFKNEEYQSRLVEQANAALLGVGMGSAITRSRLGWTIKKVTVDDCERSFTTDQIYGPNNKRFLTFLQKLSESILRFMQHGRTDILYVTVPEERGVVVFFSPEHFRIEESLRVSSLQSLQRLFPGIL